MILTLIELLFRLCYCVSPALVLDLVLTFLMLLPLV